MMDGTGVPPYCRGEPGFRVCATCLRNLRGKPPEEGVPRLIRMGYRYDTQPQSNRFCMNYLDEHIAHVYTTIEELQSTHGDGDTGQDCGGV